MLHQFFAKGVDEAACASGNAYLQRSGAFHTHGVAYAIAPQSVATAYHHFVGASLLEFPHRIGDGVVALGLFYGDKLVEHAHVEQQEHCVGVVRRLCGEESLAGIVCLHEVHLFGIGDGAILLAIWVEAYAAVEKHLKVGPDIVYRVGAFGFHHLAQHGEKPRWHARNVGDVLIDAGTHQCWQFLFPFGHKGSVLVGHAEEVYQWIDVLYEIGR